MIAGYGVVQIENVEVHRTPGSPFVEISYDLTQDQNEPCHVYLLNEGQYGLTSPSLTGDIGPDISPGTGKRIIWNTYNDLNTGNARNLPQYITDLPLYAVENSALKEGFSFVPGRTQVFIGQLVVHGPDYPWDNTVYQNAYFKSLLTYDFLVQQTEVTWEEWNEVRDWAMEHGYTDLSPGQKGSGGEGTSQPVTQVSWYDTLKWLNAKSEMEGLEPCYLENSSEKPILRVGSKIFGYAFEFLNQANGYRLPTEVEWEYAGRNNFLVPAEFWNEPSQKSPVEQIFDVTSWYQENSMGSTHPVGAKEPNIIGIYDMCGNVREWCWGANSHPYWDELRDFDPIIDWTGSDGWHYKVYRGGGYNDSLEDCLPIEYDDLTAETKNSDLGFRTVSTLAPNSVNRVEVDIGSSVIKLLEFDSPVKSLTSRNQSYQLTVFTELEWSVSENPGWLSVYPSQGSGTGTITVEVSENPEGAARIGDIVVNGEIHQVVQNPWSVDIDSQATLPNELTPSKLYIQGFDLDISSIAKSDEILALGVTGNSDPWDKENDAEGRVYIFESEDDKWNYTAQLNPSIGHEFYFGFDVEVTGNQIIVGSPNLDYYDDDWGEVPYPTQNAEEGAVYVFEQNDEGDWLEKNRWTSNTFNRNYAKFGKSLSLFEKRLMIGAPAYETDGISDIKTGGSAFLLNQDATGNWELEAILEETDGNALKEFGTNVVLAEDIALAGAPGADNGNGIIFVYKKFDDGNWRENAQIKLDEPYRTENFLFFGNTFDYSERDLVVRLTNSDEYEENFIHFRENDTGDWLPISSELTEGGGTRVKLESGKAIFRESSTSNMLYTRDAIGNWKKRTVLQHGVAEKLKTNIFEIRGDSLVVGGETILIYNLEALIDESLAHGPVIQTDSLPQTMDLDIWIPGLWSVPSLPDWISTSKTNGQGYDTLTLQISENLEPTSREAIFYTGSQRHHVVQEAWQSPRDEWLHSEFDPSSASGDYQVEADPDLDGITNGLEYVFGLDPKVDTPLSEMINMARDPNSGHFKFELNLRGGDPRISILCEVSSDLESWEQVQLDFIENTWQLSSIQTIRITNSSQLSETQWVLSIEELTGKEVLWIRFLDNYDSVP